MVLAFGDVMSCLLVMLLYLLHIHHLQDNMRIGNSLYDEKGATRVLEILEQVHCLLFANALR